MATESGERRIVVRNLVRGDFSDVREAMSEAYSGMNATPWTENQLQSLLRRFSQGQICVEVDGKVVACALSLVLDYDRFGDRHTYEQVTARGRFTTHDPQGDVLYGIDVFVHPDYRDMRLGRRLYDARKRICEDLNLRAIVAGGRIPGYESHADDLSPGEYIDKVKDREIYDPILTFQLANGFHVRRVLRNYLPEDSQSHKYATLIEWINVHYEEAPPSIGGPRATVRLGVVQWQMRPFADLDALVAQVEFFVDAVSSYKTDFCLLPDFFAAPLMARFGGIPEPEAIRKLAGFTAELRERLSKLAVQYNTNIVAGSMPIVEKRRLYSASYLLRRDGSWEEQRKLHITPSESASWGMQGGSRQQVFASDCGPVAILVDHDIEFPELVRMCAAEGVRILFVPFSTDTRNAYNRIRLCAAARAIENECFVAIAGCVGNLPGVSNMDIQYAQSAVLSPCDLAFPIDGIVTETTPNTESTLVCELDFDLLKELHWRGSVRNLEARRSDLYRIRAHKPQRWV